jgi:hypothetical protein
VRFFLSCSPFVPRTTSLLSPTCLSPAPGLPSPTLLCYTPVRRTESNGGNLIGLAFALPVVLCVASFVLHSETHEVFRSALDIIVRILGVTIYVLLAILSFVGIPVLLLFLIVRLVHFFWSM